MNEKKKRGARNAAKTKLKSVRIGSGLTQVAVAESAGLNLRTYQSYEIGNRLIDNAGLNVILPICRTFNCSIEDVLESTELIAELREYEKNRL